MGLSFRYLSSLTQDQLGDLPDAQRRDYEELSELEAGQCVPVDVARTSAWQCQPLTFYLDGDPKIASYYFYRPTSEQREELTEQYQVVCMGVRIDLGGSRTFSWWYLGGAAVVGAGAV